MASPPIAPATPPPPQPGEVPATSARTLRPWSSLPAPDPAQAVPLLDSPSERPVRRSLPDDTLLHWADGSDGEPTSTLDIIQRLESQLDLREREDREYASWEAHMRSLGTPDAVADAAGTRADVDEPAPVEPVHAQSRPLAEPESAEIDQVAPPEVVSAPIVPPEVAPPALIEPELAPPAITPVPSETGSRDDAAIDEAAMNSAAIEDRGDSVENQPADADADAEPVLRRDPPPLVEPPRHPQSAVAKSTGAQSAGAQSAGVQESDPKPLFIDSLSLAAGQAVSTDTDSVAVVAEYETELDDDVDEFDRVIQGGDGGVAPPSGPISTIRIPDDEVVLYPDEPIRHRVFSLEVAGPEPTDRDYRAGRAARLFWLWFAANSSILSLALGAAIVTAGMSLRQSVVAVLAGTALSFLPLGLSTLAGKRSGQPTMVVSRATFGLVGNAVPAVLALVTRLFWGAVMLWALASAASSILVGSGLDAGLEPHATLLLCLAVAFLIAVLVAFAGYPLLARMQLILSIVSAVLVVGLIVLTAPYVNMPAALTISDGPWLLTVTGAVLVFSFVGLVWAQSGGDLARYQRVGSSGGASMLWATFGTTVPSFALIAWGAVLGASDPVIASGLLASPVDTLSVMLPAWYPLPLLAATVLSLLAGTTIALYSGGFALQAAGVRLRRPWSILVVGTLLGALALLLTFGVSGGIVEFFRDIATTLAVPTAAWAGIFAAEMMIRSRNVDSPSLLARGGAYADVRWVNLSALILITVVGFGFTTATVDWLSWQGFGFVLGGIPVDSDLAGTDLGVVIALGLGLLVPIVAGIPAIRRQEGEWLRR